MVNRNTLVVVISAILCVLCGSAFAQFDTNKITHVFHGNTITFSGVRHTYYHLEDKRITDTIRNLLSVDKRQPILFNGEEIFPVSEKKVIVQPGALTFRDYVLSGLHDILQELPDNEYSLKLINVIIDKKGKVAYYDDGERLCIRSSNNGPVPIPLREALHKKIAELMQAMQAQPLKQNNKLIYALLDEPFITLTIKVNRHNIFYP